MPTGDGPPSGPPSGPPEGGPPDMSEEEKDSARRKELEHNDAVYERIVKNIEKSKERFRIQEAFLDKLENISELERQRLILAESRFNQIGAETDALLRLIELSESKVGIDDNGLQNAADRLKSMDEEMTYLQNLQNEYGVQFDTLKDISSEMEAAMETAKNGGTILEDTLKNLKEELKLRSKTSEKDKARVNAIEKSQEKVDKVGKKILSNTSLSANASETMLGEFEGMVAEADLLTGPGKGIDLLTKQLGKTFESAFNFKNVLYKAVEFSFELAQQIEKISKDLAKATGYGDVFRGQIQEIGNQLTMIGGDEQSASEMIKSMSDNISSFNPTAERMNANLAVSIFELKQFGVSASTSTKTIDILEKAMGLTADQAVEMTSQIAIMGRKLGITTEKMVANFGTAYERITIFGSQGNSMFKELSAQVKATGLEMSKLLEISKKFDTFSGAADQVAQLNAALGTNLSSLEMLNATDSERIEIIRREVRSSVGNFDSLGKYEKLYIQQAMGVNSVAEAQRLLNMSQSEYLRNQSKQQEAADAQAELAKNASELVPALTKLTNLLLKMLKIFQPFVYFFIMIGDGIDWLFSQFEGWTADAESFSLGLLLLRDAIVGIAIAWAILTGALTGGIAWLLGGAAAFGAIYEIVHRPGSRSMAGGLFDKDIGASFGRMANSMKSASGEINNTSDSLNNLYDSVHKTGGNKVDITAMAKMDTGKIASGITMVKSALQELSTLKIDGFIAMTTDGNKSSFAVASEGVIKSLSEGRLTVDVNMPELTLPPIKVVIESKGTNLSDFIDARVEKRGIA